MLNNISKKHYGELFNFARIHFGLGKIQQKIMDILEEEGTEWAIMDNDSLTSKVYYPDLHGIKLWSGKDYPVTRSQLNTVRKSVKALERRGLVKTEVIFFMSNNGARYGKGVSLAEKQKVKALVPEDIKEKDEVENMKELVRKMRAKHNQKM